MEMQDQQLGESPSNMEAFNWTSLPEFTASINSMRLSQNNEGTDECNINESRKKEDKVELEMIQQSLPRGNGTGRNSEGFSESIHCTSEPNSSWGDFESFSESLVKAKSFNHTIEVLVNSAETKMSKTDRELNEEHCNGSHCSKPSAHSGREASCSSLDEANLSSEDIFKLGFPEVTVPQSKESIRSLDQVLDTHNEDAGIPEFMKRQLCIDSGNLWRILRDSDSNSGLRHPWNKSHCQENFLSVLGIDVNQKDLSGNSQVGLEEMNININEDAEVDGFNFCHCKALIQTKLSVSPDSRHGHLFSYNLFLKRTPSNGNMQFKTAPRKKKIFTTHSLKMKIFNNDVW
uniref:Clathrin binding box of aftiphilin containing 1 n=1 Tax=Pelusios castaneus TaxID=367368 RepID=A0A8C8R735_9SAUR